MRPIGFARTILSGWFSRLLRLIRTFETRLDLREGCGSSLACVLDQYAALMSRAERLLLGRLKAGRVWTGDLKVSFYQHLGLSSAHLDMAYRQLQAKLKSVAELASDRVKQLTGKIASKRTDIIRKDKALAKAIAERSKLPEKLRDLQGKIAKWRASLATVKDSMRAKHLFVLKQHLDQWHAKTAAAASIRHRIQALRAALHQHKRRLGILENRKAEAQRQAADPTMCFGSRKLFRAQFALAESSYGDIEAWRKDWRSSRSAQMTIDGNAATSSLGSAAGKTAATILNSGCRRRWRTSPRGRSSSLDTKSIASISQGCASITAARSSSRRSTQGAR